jgi:hypothetical protein
LLEWDIGAEESLTVNASVTIVRNTWRSEGRKVTSFLFTGHLWHASSTREEMFLIRSIVLRPLPLLEKIGEFRGVATLLLPNFRFRTYSS